MPPLRTPGRAAFAALLVLLLLGASASAASAATRHVSTTGADSGNCVAAPCATLDYVQQQVQEGDTVQLSAGVYPVGDATFPVDGVTYERGGAGEARITLPGDSYGIQVSGDDITFRDLTITSPDDTIQGDTWGFTYSGSGLTLDRMLVQHIAEGIVGGHGVTVTSSTFRDIRGTSVGTADGLLTVSGNAFTAGTGIYVTEHATVLATGNTFYGNQDGDGGRGMYVDGGSEGGTATGNRFTPVLESAISYGENIQAANNWWGCNEGVGQPGCATSESSPGELAEPHLVLDVSASPASFPTTGSSTVTTRFVSSDPESGFTGGPAGGGLTLSTTEGSLDDTEPAFVAGVAQTALRATVPGFPTVTATLDNGSASTSVEVTAAAPPATVLPATDITATSATLNGTLSPDVTAFQILYRDSGTTTWTAMDRTTATGTSVSVPSPTLRPSTTYYYKLRAIRPGLPYAYSAIARFTTSVQAPVSGDIEVLPAEDVTTVGAFLSALVDTHGAPTTALVEWGTQAGVYTKSATMSRCGCGGFERVLATNFLPGTTYHYRVTVTNAAGSASSADHTFTTLSPPAPVVTIGAVTPIGSTTATVNTVVDTDGAAITASSVQWGTTTSYGKSLPLLGGALTDGGRIYTRPLISLKPGTLYHYKVTVTTAFGTYESGDLTFTTTA